jgi:hypothetical protein
VELEPEVHETVRPSGSCHWHVLPSRRDGGANAAEWESLIRALRRRRTRVATNCNSVAQPDHRAHCHTDVHASGYCHDNPDGNEDANSDTDCGASSGAAAGNACCSVDNNTNPDADSSAAIGPAHFDSDRSSYASGSDGLEFSGGH